MRMNPSKYDFSVDTRQSKVAILLLIWKFYKIVIRQSLPFLAAILIGASKRSVYIVWGSIIVISLIVFTMAILSYFRFYFRVENNELIIQKGVFKKTKLNIPFERIQTVNFEQNLILQGFKKYKVEVDTAGSAKKEFSFDALDKDVAEQLRKSILEHKKEVQIEQKNASIEGEVGAVIFLEKQTFVEETILKLNIGDLFKIGLTENHLRAGAWLIAVVGYLFSIANDAGFKVEEKIDQGLLENLDPGMALLIAIVPILFLIMIIISVIRTMLRHYDLKFNRMENGFKIFSGLINRKEYSAPDNKIQKIAWGDNPLRRLFGIFIVHLKQAKSADTDRNKSITIPVISIYQVHTTVQHLYGEEMDKEQYNFPISIHFLIRNFFYFILIPAITAVSVGFYLNNKYAIIGGIFYLVYLSISTYIQYRKASFSFNDFLLKRKKGIYGNHFEIIPWYKVQSVEIVQSIYQRRRKLANMYFYTAAGSVKIPYIEFNKAKKLRDYALYKAESSKEEWM